MRQLSLGIQSVTILHTVKKNMVDREKNQPFTLYQTVCLIPEISQDPITTWPSVEYKVGTTHKLEVVVAPKSETQLKIKLLPASQSTSTSGKA